MVFWALVWKYIILRIASLGYFFVRIAHMCSRANGNTRLTFFFNMVKYKEKKNQSIAFSIVMQDHTVGLQWLKKKGKKLKLHIKHTNIMHQIIEGPLTPILGLKLPLYPEWDRSPVEQLTLFCRSSVYPWFRQWLPAGLWIVPHGGSYPPTAMTRWLQIT